MDSSDITGSTDEECSGNESGWTFYINSPTHEDGEEVYDRNSGEYPAAAVDDDDKDHTSDHDSMASDASSGPSQLPSGTSDYEDQTKYPSGNRSQKQAKDRGERSTKGKREPKLKAADTANSHVRKGSKGKKTN